jgi:predicted enzyme related to lactoylglutathione lyase
MIENGTFFWNQLVTTDQQKSGEFYCRLLGWSRQEVDAGPFGRFTLFKQNGKDVAGMMNPTNDYSRAHPPWWQAFVAVADVDACAARVAQCGGAVIEPPNDVPGVGRACMIADPVGAVILLMTPIAR